MNDASAPDRFRLFIAVSVPEAVKQEMERAQAELRHAVTGPGFRWTRHEQLHLTLRFLGDVEAARLEALVEALRTACAGFAALRLRAAEVGFLPDERFPRVVWAGVHDEAGELAVLQRAVQAATDEFTSEKPEQRFTGHVTLGRIKGLKRPEAAALARSASAMAGRHFGDWVAPEIELIRSRLTSQGAAHTCLAAAPLVQHFP